MSRAPADDLIRVEAQNAALYQLVLRVERGIGELGSNVDEQLEHLAGEIGRVGGRLDRFELATKQRFDGIDKRLSGMDRRFDGIDKRLSRMDQRFDGIDKRLSRMDQRFDRMDQRFDGMDERFSEVLTILGELRDKRSVD